MYSNIADVERCQLAGTSCLGNLTIDGMRERHHWPVLGDFWIRTTCANIRKEPGRGPELVDFSVTSNSMDAVQVIGVIEGIRKNK